MPANADIIQGLYDALAAGDVPVVLAGLDGRVEWIDADTFPTAGTYIGPEAVLNGVFIPLTTDIEGFRVTPSELIEGGDKVVSIGRYSGAWKATGKPFETDFVHVWTLRDGKVVRFRQYADSGPLQDAMRG
jgi:ketosteroid isomerase-like protein